MPKPSNYLKRLQTEFSNAKFIWEHEVRMHNRIMTLDIVTITLGELGYSKEDIGRFRDKYMEVEEEYCSEIIDDFDGNHDPKIVYAKDRIDRVLKEYVPEDMFVPFDERYKR